MGITQLYSASEFFETITPIEFRPGQICWVPVPNPDLIPRILDVQRNLPEEHDEIQFVLREANQREDFKRADRGLPLKYLNLRSNEELLTQRAKKRPCVILTSEVDTYPEMTALLKQKGKKHQQQDCLFVIPCFSVQNEMYGTGFIPEMVARIKCMMYRQFFYLPKSKNFSEMVARFDRVHVVIGKAPASIEPSDVCLTELLFHLFVATFLYCVSGKSDEELETVRAIVREAYPKS